MLEGEGVSEQRVGLEYAVRVLESLPSYVRVAFRTRDGREMSGLTRDWPGVGRRLTMDSGFEWFVTAESLGPERVDVVGIEVEPMRLEVV